MTFEIVSVDGSNAGEWASFMDGAFADNPAWARCYCWFHFFGGDGWNDRAAADNRADALAAISAGRFEGLLARDDGRAVGWCQAVLRNALPEPGRFAPVPEGEEGPVGAVLCFVVHPDARGRGVARALLTAAVTSFRDRGARAVFAYPNVSAKRGAGHYHGPPGLLREVGFEDLGPWGEGPQHVYRKAL